MWQRLFPMLDAIVKLSRQDAFIKTDQSIVGTNKWLGFGRMKWNFDNNKKWTTKYLEGTDKREITFFDTEIWAPDWNYCCDKGITPDIFIKLCNNEVAEVAKESLVIAVSPKLDYKYRSLIESEVNRMARLIPDATISIATRRWSGGWKIGNGIGDMNIQELQEMINR
ncbi:MAG: hypothetical protein LBR75_00370 [Prevotellaceae bacterium]|jgi:hypothetical protein|nr:hypothetical protein [Prevotellaceae bacterium]